MSGAEDYIERAEKFIKDKKIQKESHIRNIKLQKKCIEVARQEMSIHKKKIEISKRIIEIGREDVKGREAAIARDNMFVGEADAEIKSVQHILEGTKKDLKAKKDLERKVKKARRKK